MSLRCIILKISFCVFFFPPVCFAQNLPFDTSRFYAHLRQNNLFNEQLVFNKNLQKTNAKKPIIIDSLKLDVAAIYFQLNLPDSCRNTLESISKNFKPANARQNQHYLSMLILNKEYRIAQKIIETLPKATLLDLIRPSGTFSKGEDRRKQFPGEGSEGLIYINNLYDTKFQKNVGLSIAVLKRELDKKDSVYNSFSVSPTLFDIKTRYLNAPNYSPALAGIYSALIPGLGKLYIGNKNQAVTSFIANVLLAAQAAESYYKSGFTSPRFIITACVFSVFYTGNIIGSIAIAKKKKKDYFKQLDDEIFIYYTADLTKFTN